MIIGDKNISVRYLCASPHGPVPFDSKGLADFLPLTRSEAGIGASQGITYGSYLEAITAFLNNHGKDFWEAVSRRLDPEVSRISEIDIIAEKHGSDYHPARVIVCSGDLKCSFVVNVALAARGKEWLANEFDLLRRLNQQIRPGFVPEAYFKGEQTVSAKDGTHSVWRMFVGEWFHDFHEFHLRADSGKDSSSLVLWDFARGFRELSEGHTHEIYKKAAYILTWHYDPDTFEEIFPWHHASGDFVASVDGNSVEVRLITVRQYAPRLRFAERKELDRAQALLFFLANLTIRMRLDRFDGIGDIAWADPGCVAPCVQGFLEALRQKASNGLCDQRLAGMFARFARELSPADLTDAFRLVVESYHEDAPDVPIIMENLPDHILKTYLALRDIPDSL
jgi:hypothetical protein